MLLVLLQLTLEHASFGLLQEQGHMQCLCERQRRLAVVVLDGQVCLALQQHRRSIVLPAAAGPEHARLLPQVHVVHAGFSSHQELDASDLASGACPHQRRNPVVAPAVSGRAFLQQQHAALLGTFFACEVQGGKAIVVLGLDQQLSVVPHFDQIGEHVMIPALGCQHHSVLIVIGSFVHFCTTVHQSSDHFLVAGPARVVIAGPALIVSSRYVSLALQQLPNDRRGFLFT
mmetsp:Transcript_119929/g.382872  ORF Transcript_119929/g.382872 Transcript_119929/m.382872 type:complete len:230 (+) Transcript_119929:69-758(+)